MKTTALTLAAAIVTIAITVVADSSHAKGRGGFSSSRGGSPRRSFSSNSQRSFSSHRNIQRSSYGKSNFSQSRRLSQASSPRITSPTRNSFRQNNTRNLTPKRNNVPSFTPRTNSKLNPSQTRNKIVTPGQRNQVKPLGGKTIAKPNLTRPGVVNKPNLGNRTRDLNLRKPNLNSGNTLRKPNLRTNFKPKPHFGFGHKDLHKKHHWHGKWKNHHHWYKHHHNHCFTRLNWCHIRPRYCHWWYDYCQPIRYYQPTDCYIHTCNYVTADVQLSSGVVVEDARWHLGLKGVVLPGKGIGIEAVEENSPAAQAGLQVGMVITKINGIDMLDETSMPTAIESSGGTLNMSVLQSIDGPVGEVTVQMVRLASQSF